MVTTVLSPTLITSPWRFLIGATAGRSCDAFGKQGDAPVIESDDDEYWNYSTYDDDRKSTEPGEFTEPFGIAIRGQTLYVSDSPISQ